MATFSAHTASPPPPSRTPVGSRASSRYASIAPRTTSAHGPLAWGARRTHTHRSTPTPPTLAGASRLPLAVPYRTPAELLNGLPQIPAHELRVPIDSVQGARHDVLLCRVDRPRKGFHPIRPRSRLRRRPPRCLHHFVSHPAKKEGIGLLEVLDRVTMQVFVRENCTMIAAPVQCDVDVIPKGSHCARVTHMG